MAGERLLEPRPHEVFGFHNNPAVFQLATIPLLAGDGFNLIPTLVKHS